ncbi:hypothetical protein QYM36_019879, partial [Artemia franciscana]
SQLSSLHVAVRLGLTPYIAHLLASLDDPDPEDDDGATPLIVAAREGYAQICIDLLEASADIEYKDSVGWTALMWASYKGKTDVARCLIERGADVNCSGHHNAQPLIWACGRGYLEIAKMLLESKANPNRPDKHGNTPLIWAARKGNLEIVELLLKFGAKIEVVGMKSWTPLLVSVEGNYRSVVKKILEKKPNLSVMDADGHTPLTIACKKGYIEICQLLLDAGATVNCHDRYNDTILIHAVKSGHRQIVEKLLKKHADVDAQGKNGKTAVHWAIARNHIAILKLLLNVSPSLEIFSDDGDTPLLCAVKARNVDSVQILLEKRAKVSATDHHGDTALHIAMRVRNRPITELILKDIKNSKLLYKPNKAGETPYNIDHSHEKPILTMISGSRRLFSSHDSENSLGYGLYGSALADILIDPGTALPLTIGLFAKWGSGKSFLIGKLKDELQNFGSDCVNLSFRMSVSLIFLLLNTAMVIGLTIGLAVQNVVSGIISTSVIFVVSLALILSLSAYAGGKWSYYKPVRFTQFYLWLYKFILLNKILFCHPPDENARSEKDAKPLQFVFADHAKVSPGSSEVSVLGIIISLFEKIENKYGGVPTRLSRLFRSKVGKGTMDWRFRRVCCLPSILVFVTLVDITLIGIGLMANYVQHILLPESYEDDDKSLTAVKVSMITCGVIFAVSLIASLGGLFRALLALAISPRFRLKKEMARFANLSSDGQHLHVLREEVKQLVDTVRTLDSFCGRTTRMTVALDGLDTCRQEQVVAILDAVSLLFSEPNSPFIVILAIDPHLVSKAIESNVSCVLSETPLNGSNYLRNIVQLPFYLQNAGLRKIKTSQQAALTARGLADEGLGPSSVKSQAKRMPSDSSCVSAGLRHNRSSAANLNKKYQFIESDGSVRNKNLSDSMESGIALMGFGHSDITKVLLTDDYFSDVNPKSLRRLMNVVSVSGRLLKAFHVDFNWIHLASWINLTEQWPYRMAWIVVYVEERERCEDSVSLRSLYDKVKGLVPSVNDPFIDLDKDPKKLEALLSSSRNNLQLVHLKIFIPFTINMDPFLIKHIKENYKESIFGPAKCTSVEINRHNGSDRNIRDVGSASRCPCLAAAGSICLHPLIPDVLLNHRLVDLSTETLCHGIQLIEGMSASRLQEMADVLKLNNICGRVLLLCSLEDLKPVLNMNFGDWELFKSLVLALRNREASLPASRSIDQPQMSHRSVVRHDSNASIYDKQITLEEQSIHGALQILNEEASEDVTENAIEEDLSAATGELVNSDETGVLFLQTNPVVSSAGAVSDLGSSTASLVTPTNSARTRTVTEVIWQDSASHQSLSRAASQKSVIDAVPMMTPGKSMNSWTHDRLTRRPQSQEIVVLRDYHQDDILETGRFSPSEERQPLVSSGASTHVAAHYIHERRRSTKSNH